MKKTKTILLLIVSMILLLIPFALYFINFFNSDFSVETETWGYFGDYLNGTFMPIIALLGIFVTYKLGIISDKRNESNILIDQQKQRPLLHIDYLDAEDEINIFMQNKGNGPLLIDKYEVINMENNIDLKGLFFALPNENILYNNYTGNLNKIILSKNEKVDLLSFKLSHFKDAKDFNIDSFNHDRESIRNALKKLKIVVNYKDVYDNKMPVYERSLVWFGRHN